MFFRYVRMLGITAATSVGVLGTVTSAGTWNIQADIIAIHAAAAEYGFGISDRRGYQMAPEGNQDWWLGTISLYHNGGQVMVNVEGTESPAT